MQTTPTAATGPTYSPSEAVRGWLSRPRHGTRLLGLGLAAGVVTRWAFGDVPGLGVFVWTVAVVGGFAAAGGREGLSRARPAHGWMVAALFFSSMVAVRDSLELTAFNLLATALLLLLAAQDAVGGEPRRQGLLDVLADTLRATGGTVQGAVAVGQTAATHSRGLAARAPGQSAAVLRGVALAAPVVVVLGALLASGDERFGSAVGGALEGLPHHVLTALSWGFWSLLTGLVIAGGWAWGLRRRGAVAGVASAVRQVGATEGLVVLGSVALLFAAFLAVQANAMFGQDPSQQGTGLTYAGWAREGFFELTLVSALTWGLIELAQRRVKAVGRGQDVLLRAGASLVVVETLVILLSAHVRLELYDETYGFTVRRIFAHAIIAWLGLCLLSRGLTLWVARTRCLQWVVCSALAVLAGLNTLNPDAFVVRANLQRSEEVVAIDWVYFTRLSADAAPELAKVLDRVPDDWSRDRLAAMVFPCHLAPWSVASLNLARLRARAVVPHEACRPRPSEAGPPQTPLDGALADAF